MRASEAFIHRPVATALLALGILLLGITAYRLLPVASMPSVDLPTIFLRAELPGASPETMAATVATPLERQLGIIAGLSELTSINTVGGSTIIAQFDLSRNVDSAARDVQAAIDAARGTLPSNLPAPPFYVKANPNEFPIMTLALTSPTLPGGTVYDYASSVVAQKLSELDGIGQVEVDGAEKTALRVQVDPSVLASLGLGLEDVRAALGGATEDFPKGSFDSTQQSIEVAADDQLFTAAAWRDVVIAWRDGAPIRLGAVAKVIDGTVDSKVESLWNGQKAIVLQLRKQPGANAVETIDRVQAILPLLRHWLPSSIEFHVTGTQTEIVRSGIADLHLTLAATIALVILVIGLFLRRFWATAIPSVAIPVSLAGTFTVMYATGCGLDNLSLMTLTIAVGFVVDDAVVVIENIVRLIEAGAAPMTAAIRGVRQMGFTVVSITASLVAALIPILFMPGELGLFFREFGIALCSAIVISAAVSLTLTPAMCARLLPPRSIARQDDAIDRALRRLTALYGASLEAALRRPRLMLGSVLLILGLTLGLFAVLPKGLLPSEDLGVIRGVTDAPPDISFAAMRDRQRAIAALIEADPAVESVISSVGAGLWNPLNTGSLTIGLKPLAGRRVSTTQVADRLRAALAKVPGLAVYLSPVEDFSVGGRLGKARYQYTLAGPKLDALEGAASRLRDAMRRMPELRDVSTDEDADGLQANLALDRTSAARLGVSAESIDETLYDAFGQRQVATLYAPLDQFKLILELDPAYQKDPHTLATLRVAAGGGAQVPLSAMTRVDQGFAPMLLNHQGQLPAITLGFDTAPGVSIGQAIALIDRAAGNLRLPGDIVAGFAGTAGAAQRADADQLWLLLGAIVAVYLVLGILYESFAHPLTILSTIPSAGLGAGLALLVTRTELSVIAMIGLILLIGIVKKNAIMMVDFAIVAERTLGLAPDAAIFRAALLRFRPILMTNLTAALGALPLALGTGTGAELRRPLGIVVVGGLLVSQFVTLYTTPVIYLAVDRLRARRKALPIQVPAE
jgi:hydrophobe/amphiphile efflux-1 (HAE1) family protein